MYPNSIYFGLKVLPNKGTLGPKYILFGHMGPYNYPTPLTLMVLIEPLKDTRKGTLFGYMDPLAYEASELEADCVSRFKVSALGFGVFGFRV